eukprot:COSAG06_NODE_8602_length_2117_cov_20.560951_1_plen_46_part_00
MPSLIVDTMKNAVQPAPTAQQKGLHATAVLRAAMRAGPTDYRTRS